jgi:hypothetical protein
MNILIGLAFALAAALLGLDSILNTQTRWHEWWLVVCLIGSVFWFAS